MSTDSAPFLPPNASGIAQAAFHTTHWSIIQLAGSGSSPEAQSALAALFRAYWYPAYAHVRRAGHPPATAQDVVQDVFLALISKDQLAAVGPGRGRFRSYLLTAINHHLANEWHRRNAEKRGGGAIHLPLDATLAEEQYAADAVDLRSPEILFDRRWALTVLERASAQLRAEWTSAGKATVFAHLLPYLDGDQNAPPLARTAHELDLNEGALRVTIHRLRRRYRELVREEIAATLTHPEDVEDEIRHLLQVLRTTG